MKPGSPDSDHKFRLMNLLLWDVFQRFVRVKPLWGVVAQTRQRLGNSRDPYYFSTLPTKILWRSPCDQFAINLLWHER
jgi:hypothetical protein